MPQSKILQRGIYIKLKHFDGMHLNLFLRLNFSKHINFLTVLDKLVKMMILRIRQFLIIDFLVFEERRKFSLPCFILCFYTKLRVHSKNKVISRRWWKIGVQKSSINKI